MVRAHSDRADAQLSFDVVIVGAGFAGLYAIHKLRGMGLSVRAIEANAGLGGTWYANRYPGCRCDFESLDYSYSFSEELQQSWNWPERFSSRADIHRYVEHVADRFDLRRDIELSTRVSSARFDRSAARWLITTDRGTRHHARFLVMATGNLSVPLIPEVLDPVRFKGPAHHTAGWPDEGVDVSGKVVGVIGTGASAIQAIPELAREARHLYVFQRTPNFVLPSRNAPADPEETRRHKANYRTKREQARLSPFGLSGYVNPTHCAMDVTPEVRKARFEAAWQAGDTVAFQFAFTDILINKGANNAAAEFAREKIREVVRDPAVAERLTPRGYPIGARRLLIGSNYYETFNRQNVTLVDVESDPIVGIEAEGVQTSDRLYPLDVLCLATGFDAVTGALDRIAIEGGDGVSLKAAWADGPRTFLGLMTARFPNLFMLMGPQSPGVRSQMILSAEHHVELVATLLAEIRRRNATIIEADPTAENDWVTHSRSVADKTLYPLAKSWYLRPDPSGKRSTVLPYVGGVHVYRRLCQQMIDRGFQGFRISGREALHDRVGHKSMV
ncbi:MAG TPA: NAD(P)/FAD-dependent oxidoreductase [Hyphomicrobiaceae bacterium]|nr:NAD(P)/FAD-dependent oxidoreductase [Hyphomicrobiaceae bacterium]